MVLWEIVHRYDTEEKTQEQILFTTADKVKADTYVKKYSKPVIYKRSNGRSLYCHELILRKKELNDKIDLRVNPFKGGRDVVI